MTANLLQPQPTQLDNHAPSALDDEWENGWEEDETDAVAGILTTDTARCPDCFH